jgi:3',5'-cyclic AMP phosphodiesterase CpdA
VLATGDLVERGDLDEYERLRALLEPLAMPIYLIPGNHDDRANLARVFDRHNYLPRTGPLQYAIEEWPVRLVAIDTLVPGESGGRLTREQLDWLDAVLAAEPSRPTIVVMHHPPFVTGIKKMDEMGLDGSDDLAAVIRRHPQVERIACGHLHRSIVRRFAGTVACTAPATAHQIALDLGAEARLAVVMEPPACLLHLWLGPEQGLVTHLSVIGDRHAPFTVFDGREWLRSAAPPVGFHPHP